MPHLGELGRLVAVASTLCGCIGSAAPTSKAPSDESSPPKSAEANLPPSEQRAPWIKDLLEAGYPKDQLCVVAPLQQAVLVARHVDDLALRARAFSDLANCLVWHGKYAQGRALIDEATPWVKPGSLEADGRIYYLQAVKGASFRAESRNAESIAPFTIAWEATARHDTELASELVDTTDRLAPVLRAQGQVTRAIAIEERALVVADREPRNDKAGELLVELMVDHLRLGQTDRVAELSGSHNTWGRELKLPAHIFSNIPSLEALVPDRLPPFVYDEPGDPVAPGFGVPGGHAELASMREDFGNCINAAWERTPNAVPGLRVVVSLGSDGRVVDVKALGVGFDVALADCIMTRVARGHFQAPRSGSAVIAVPMIF